MKASMMVLHVMSMHEIYKLHELFYVKAFYYTTIRGHIAF